MRVGGITAIVLGLAIPAVQAADLSTREASRVQEAATVLLEIHGVPDKDIPQELWENAACVIVVPGLKKAAFIVDGEASIAAGPVGRDARAATDVQMKAEILSYSRTQGLFAGINLSGGVVRADVDDNVNLYGKTIAPTDVVLTGTVKAPAVTDAFMAALKHQK